MAETEIAVLGGGCFWCTEAAFLELRGVSEVVSGYAGGTVTNPSYKQVCGGATGHAEVVRVGFDPAVLSYDDLLRVFFTSHDPTTKNRQGNDVGTQYRSVIFTTSEAQAETARRVIAEFETKGAWPAPIVTEIEPLQTFWPAEEEHQDFFARNPYHGYCNAVAAPKIVKLRKMFADKLRKVA